MLFALVLAAAAAGGSTGGGVDVTELLKYGVTPVVVVTLMLTRLLLVGPLIEKERENERKLWQVAVDQASARATAAEERAAKAEASVERLHQANEDKVLPALFAATQAQRDVLGVILEKGRAP